MYINKLIDFISFSLSLSQYIGVLERIEREKKEKCKLLLEKIKWNIIFIVVSMNTKSIWPDIFSSTYKNIYRCKKNWFGLDRSHFNS